MVEATPQKIEIIRMVQHLSGPVGPIFCLGPIWVPFGDPFFVWGPFWVPFGDPFALGPIGGPWDQVEGSVRPLEAEGRLFGGPGAEPPGISPILAYVGLFWTRDGARSALEPEGHRTNAPMHGVLQQTFP